MAGLNELTTEAIDRINGLGASLAGGLQSVLDELKIKAQIKGYGSLQQIHFSPEPISTASTAFFTIDRDILRLFHLSLMNKGIFIPNRGFFAISTPMSEAETDKAVEVESETETISAELKPGERRVISNGSDGPIVEIIKRSIHNIIKDISKYISRFINLP